MQYVSIIRSQGTLHSRVPEGHYVDFWWGFLPDRCARCKVYIALGSMFISFAWDPGLGFEVYGFGSGSEFRVGY